jgi:16S rRNA (guanine966-N2)-methyltransferase
MLKITSGKYRSRILETPATGTIPTKSIVRTAMANALMDALPGAEVLDLFAGSGALGFEALSRGARHCVFVDKAPEAIAVLQKNLATLKETNAEVRFVDYETALKDFAAEKKTFDVVFLDPPYAMKEVYSSVPAALLQQGLLSPRAVLVLEYEGEIEAPVSLFALSKTYNYGRTHVLILRR